MTTRPRPRARLAAAAPVIFLALTACSGGPADGPASGDVADADVEFAQMMIVHHRGAVEMAGLADGRTDDPELLALAEHVVEDQEPEIARMTAWLEEWGADVPAAGGSGSPDDAGSGHGGSDHGGTDDGGTGHGDTDHGGTGHGGDEGPMPGMMTAAQMAELEAARGPAFDEAFLTMMIEHHEGALTMAEDVQASGRNPEALELAETIVEHQTAEIAEMRALLER